MLKNHHRRLTCQIGVLVAAIAFVSGTAVAQEEISARASSKTAPKKAGKASKPKKKPDFPPFSKVSEGFTKVVSTADGGKSLYTIWTREKDGQMLAELPRNIEKQNLYIATTISAGIPTAGIQFGTFYAKWKKYDKRLALLAPNLEVRTTGDQESKNSHTELFTDRVILDIPIIAKGPSGGYVIDLDELLVGKAKSFFGGIASGINSKLVTISKAKAFSKNVEISITAPVRPNNNRLTTFSYSFSVLPERTGYKPRKADPRVGYFATAYQDLAKVPDDDSYTRYINRWKLEKADPKLKLSPPKEPIVFYIDHTVPIRYRRWVREGILEWNKAFEKVGILNAIEVYQQDATTGAHMEKDPEDVRYNFMVWDSNGAGFAIGPSRVDPRTGQILDADVVMNDGWLRFSASQWENVIPQNAMENFGPETYAWLDTHPQWDPRIRLLPVSQQAEAIRQRKFDLASGARPYGGHPAANSDARFIGDDPYDGLSGQISQVNGYCAVTNERGIELTMARAGLLPLMNPSGDEDDDQMLDGAPEWFVGSMLKDVISHEIGHTLGLRHNFKASTIYTMEEINSPEMKGKAFTGSVMDYNSINIQYGDLGDTQVSYFMPTIGPYDYFAIEYGYTAKDKDLKEILSRASEKKNSFGTDEDTWGPDPTARRRDMGGNPLEFEKSMVELVKDLRENIIDRVMEDGDSWMKVRNAYGTTLGLQFRTISNAANWVGGTYVYRDRKGDPGDRDPVVPVEPKLQREALNLVIDNAFNDDAYGLTPELLSKMGIDKWFDLGSRRVLFADPPYDVHDTVLAVQSIAMTMLLNPTTLKRVYDLEYRVDANEDALTLPEVLYGVTDAAWSELDNRSDKRFTARKPMISSLRRDLQSENLDRLIDLTMPGGMIGAAAHPIATLSAHKLRELKKKIARVLERSDSKIDPYTLAHLEDASIRIEKALDASYVYNTDDFGS